MEGSHEFLLIDDFSGRHGQWVKTNSFTTIDDGKLFAPGNLRGTQVSHHLVCTVDCCCGLFSWLPQLCVAECVGKLLVLRYVFSNVQDGRWCGLCLLIDSKISKVVIVTLLHTPMHA